MAEWPVSSYLHDDNIECTLSFYVLDDIPFVDGKRSQGRPKNSWIGCDEKDAIAFNIPIWYKILMDTAGFWHSLRTTMGLRVP